MTDLIWSIARDALWHLVRRIYAIMCRLDGYGHECNRRSGKHRVSAEYS